MLVRDRSHRLGWQRPAMMGVRQAALWSSCELAVPAISRHLQALFVCKLAAKFSDISRRDPRMKVAPTYRSASGVRAVQLPFH
jgi:hypothetical protein